MELQPGAPHLEQGGFPRVSQPCLPPQAGSDTWTSPLRRSHPASCWVQNPGYPIEKNAAFFFSPFPQSFLQTHPFFTSGEMLTCQHCFSARLQNSNPGKVQPICLFSMVFSLPKAQSLPQKLLQLMCPCSPGGCDAMRIPPPTLQLWLLPPDPSGAPRAPLQPTLPCTSTAPPSPAFPSGSASLQVHIRAQLIHRGLPVPAQERGGGGGS